MGYYESRLARLALDERERPDIDPDFEEATEGEEIDRKEKLKTRWAQLEAIVGADNPPAWQPHVRNKPRREALAKRFRDPGDPLRVDDRPGQGNRLNFGGDRQGLIGILCQSMPVAFWEGQRDDRRCRSPD